MAKESSRWSEARIDGFAWMDEGEKMKCKIVLTNGVGIKDNKKIWNRRGLKYIGG